MSLVTESGLIYQKKLNYKSERINKNIKKSWKKKNRRHENFLDREVQKLNLERKKQFLDKINARCISRELNKQFKDIIKQS